MKRDVTPANKIILFIALAVLAFAVSLFDGRPRAQSSEGVPKLRSREVIVEIRDGASIEDVNQRNRTKTIQHLIGTNFYQLLIPAGKREKKWSKRLRRDPDVLTAEPNPLVASPFTPFKRSIMSFPDRRAELRHSRDEYLSQQELFDRLNLQQAQLRSRGKGVVVAVVDTGVDPRHEAIKDHLHAAGYDFIEGDSDPTESPGNPEQDVAGHGTFIAGLIALVAPECRIMAIRAFTPKGESSVFHLAAAIRFAVANGADIINLSCGAAEPSQTLEDAINYAREQNVLVIAAAGNEDTPELRYPASLETCIGVGAVDTFDRVPERLRDRKSYFSNYGQNVALAAPGADLISAYPGDAYAEWNGTSFAAPLVAAEAALVLAADPDKENARYAIEQTAANIDAINPGFEGLFGRGRINPLAALLSVTTGPVADLYSLVALINAGVEPEAEGEAEVFVVGEYQQLRVSARNLEPHRSYRIFADDQELRAGAANVNPFLTADAFRGIEVIFSNQPDVDPDDNVSRLPDELLPVNRIKRVELRDEEGRVIAVNQFAPVTDRAQAGQYFQKEAKLTAPGGLTAAAGVARVVVYDERTLVTIDGEYLPSPASRVVIDGVSVEVPATAAGFAKLVFSTDGSEGLPLPVAVRPAANIRSIELRDAEDRVLLRGGFVYLGSSVGVVAPSGKTVR